MKRMPTGIKGLDEMLGGGFPEERVVLVYGGSGTGKTIFSLQFLASAAERGVHGIYVNLETPIKSVKENIESFGWNISEKEKNKLIRLLDYNTLHPARLPKNNVKYKDPVQAIINEVTDSEKSIGAKLLVIDPLACLTIHEQGVSVKRRRIVELFNYLRSGSYTALLTSGMVPNVSEYYIEDFLADGIIKLDKVINNFNLIRTIRIEKMRGIEHDEQPRRYVIGEKGFTVYNTEPVKL
jgi:KaiC/GvpD/RAD55 family RecA-like ATPase